MQGALSKLENVPVPPRCQAYLIVDAGAAEMRPIQLTQSVQACRAASVLLRPGKAAPGTLQALVAACQAAGAAALIEGDAKFALELGADGVHLPYAPDLAAAEQAYRHARAILGAGRIAGVSAGLVRHDAMVFAELGADYVAFEDAGGSDFAGLIGIVEWWAEMFVVPCVALGASSREQAAQLALAGADFVAAASLDSLAGLNEPLGAPV